MYTPQERHTCTNYKNPPSNFERGFLMHVL